ncbi:MAG TPA: alpha/beta fold hydrolase [Burkholderiales bacterium]
MHADRQAVGEVPEAALTLAANPLVGVRGQDILAAAGTLFTEMARRPGIAVQQYFSLLGELGRIALGRSELAPAPQDKRFSDPAWKESPGYRALAQAWLAWGLALNRFVDQAGMARRDAERARFVVSLLVDAFAPTNSLGGNPAALKRLLDTGGASFARGIENFVADLGNGGLPAQVDPSQFAVGKNLATSAGAVVHRSPVMELIQYKPTTGQVHARPLLIAPPQINKFYVFDLAPEKSIVQLALQGGLQTFAVSWKNPTRAESHFGLDTYVAALEEAADVMRGITGAEDVNIWGACSGGITTSALLARLAERGSRKVHCATIAVCVLDMAMAQDTTAGMFITPQSVLAAKAASQFAGVLEGQELARMFAWMRPNDLVWNYWVNNYLMGNAPPAFDILYWNCDSTRLPAKLHADFLDLIDSNPFVRDMRRVDLDAYVVAGLSDHITPWRGCYSTARLYGERTTFVVSNSGHIQSLLNPPGNPKAFFWSGEPRAPTAEAWLEKATKSQGSWWPHWLEWIKARSGPLHEAPPLENNLGAAPGRYVLEK